MNSTLKRKKSISSQAASISAWCAVFDWFSIVAATIVVRHGPASSLAARRKTAARSSHGVRDRSCQVDVRENVLLAVRHHRLDGVAAADLLAADHARDVEPLAFQLREPLLQL